MTAGIVIIVVVLGTAIVIGATAAVIVNIAPMLARLVYARQQLAEHQQALRPQPEF